MTDDEKKKLRDGRRAVNDCGVPSPTPAPADSCKGVDLGRAVNRVDPCAPEEICEPDKFVKPNAIVTPATRVYLTPVPLVVYNQQVALSCPDGKVGPQSLVASAAISSSFDWRSIPDIRIEQLDLIARMADPGVVLGFDAVTIRNETKLDPTQTTFLIEAITELSSDLQQSAYLAALQSLDCWYENTNQSAQCPAGALSDRINGGPVVKFQVTVPAGSFRSYQDQAEADSLALLEAQTSIICCYGNDYVSKQCPDDVDESGAPRSSFGNPRSYEVLENTIFSCESKALANQIASDVAQAALDCWYENKEIILTCDYKAPESRLFKLLGSTEVTLTATFGGLPAITLAGTIISRVGSKEADAEALVATQAALSCMWSNADVTIACDGTHDVIKTGAGGMVHAPVEMFTAPDIAANVLDQLRTFLTISLQCVYCNPEIPPLCNEFSMEYTYGIAAGTVCGDTPIDVLTIARSMADIPRLASAKNGNCLYGNDEVIFDCPHKVPSANPADFDPLSTGPVTIPANSYQVRAETPEVGKAIANGLAIHAASSALFCFFSNDGGTFYCENADGQMDTAVSPDASGSSLNPIVVPPGIFTSLKSKAEANEQEKAYVAALLDCYYDNERITMLCLDESPLKGDVSPEAWGSSFRPVIIEAKMFQSYISVAAANELAKVAARGMLDCFLLSDPRKYTCADIGKAGPGLIPSPPVNFPRGYLRTYTSRAAMYEELFMVAVSILYCAYCNEGQSSGDCPEGMLKTAGGTVPACTIITLVSQEMSNAIAKALAEGMLTCIDPDDLEGDDGEDGSPGNDGAQKDCAGPCFGFYS